MTRVLGVHGVRNYKAADSTPHLGSARLRSDWLAALGDAASGLELETAYYADLLRSERQSTEPADEELALVEQWARAWGGGSERGAGPGHGLAAVDLRPGRRAGGRAARGGREKREAVLSRGHPVLRRRA
ncbi:hypothetical protein [Streptomyces sp. WAC05950]|uniref:hypothetical protein n=1 Tax=Streptomyces sp. WAC05950 TaxID=2487419 RepID=UPI00163CCC0C|nr:hypothetical protein [Streptomyces sp. WAC05950]